MGKISVSQYQIKQFPLFDIRLFEMKFIAIGILSALLASVESLRLREEHEADVQYCLKYDGKGNCTQCIFRTVLKDNKCIKVNDQCRTWNERNALCTGCYEGYTLTNGQCLLGGSGSNNGGKDQKDSKSQDNSRGSRGSKGQKESSRKQDRIKNRGPGNYKIINCNQYDAQGYCLKCSQRYVWKNGDCVKVSDQCNTWSERTGKCKSCYIGSTLQNGVCK